MKRKRTVGFRVGYIAAVLLFIAFCLGPILWSFIMSITPQSEMMGEVTTFLPENPPPKGYSKSDPL